MGSGRQNLAILGGFRPPHPLSTDQQSWTQTKALRSFPKNYTGRYRNGPLEDLPHGL